MANSTPDTIRHVNYTAVTITSIAAFILGGLWYSPAGFEKAWRLAHGYTAADTAQIMEQLVPFGFLSTFLAYFLSCFITAVLCLMVGARSWKAGARLGVLLWIGYAAAISLTTNLFSSSTIVGWWIDTGFQFLFLVIAGSVLTAWHPGSHSESRSGSAPQT